MTRQHGIGEGDDLAIVAAAEATDTRRAFALLVENFQKDVVRFCYHILRDGTEAADATQETFLAALEALSGFRGQASLKTWIFGIARRRCIDRLRKKTRRKTDATEKMEHHVDDEPLADARLEEREGVEMLHRLLTELPEIDQSILLLRFDHGLSFQEVGQALGLRADNAKVRAHRAIVRLRPMLQKLGSGQ